MDHLCHILVYITMPVCFSCTPSSHSVCAVYVCLHLLLCLVNWFPLLPYTISNTFLGSLVVLVDGELPYIYLCSNTNLQCRVFQLIPCYYCGMGSRPCIYPMPHDISHVHTCLIIPMLYIQLPFTGWECSIVSNMGIL